MNYVNYYKSPIGNIIVLSDGEKLTGLYFEGQKYFDSAIINNCCNEQLPVFSEVFKWLDMYFGGSEPDFIPDYKLLNCSEFACNVYKILLDIPYGRVLSYGYVAKLLEKQTSKKVSAQAVGRAVAHNPISLIIPCHRVVGSSGGLTGYAGGLDKKQALLILEKIKI